MITQNSIFSADSASPWLAYFEPLLQLYGKKKHPLDYQNRYQLIVMIILSAQDSDKHINELAPAFFKDYPTIAHLAKATADDLRNRLSSVRNFDNKSKWLIKLAETVGEDDKLPTTLDELTKLPGVGRKSANVFIRESGGKAEGVIVDLHVVRVAPRIGIATGDKPEKIEKQLMESIPHDRWNELGMAISFLGREICRPTNPKCDICVMKEKCKYFLGGLVQTV
jgi:endonuclease III